MKIAVVTEDGKTVSRYFGRAPYYLVLTIENGQVVSREMRERQWPGRFGGNPTGHRYAHGGASGYRNNAEGQAKPARQVEIISDCQILICRGIGQNAHERLLRFKIQPLVTECQAIDEAVQAYLQGNDVAPSD